MKIQNEEESLYKKIQTQQDKSDQELFKLSGERMQMKEGEKREIPDKLDKMMEQSKNDNNDDSGRWNRDVIIPILVAVVAGLIVWAIIKFYF